MAAGQVTLRSQKTQFLTFEEMDANLVLLQNNIDSLATFLNTTYVNHLSDWNVFLADYNAFKTSVATQFANVIQTNTANTFTNTNTFNSNVNIKTLAAQNGQADNFTLGGTTPAPGTFSNLVLKVGSADLSLGRYLRVPQWTSSTRPSPLKNMIGFNTDTSRYEVWNGTVWEFFYTSSNAGTAAQYDVMTSTTDATVGRIIRVGDLGQGISIQIPGGANLNSYVIPGRYAQPSSAQAASGTNYPLAYAGLLIVDTWTGSLGGGAGLIQKYYRYDNGTQYQRTLYQGNWSAWTMDIVGAPNGNVTITGVLHANNSIGVGSAIYQTDGNVYGGVWGGYLSNSVQNAVNIGNNAYNTAVNANNNANGRAPISANCQWNSGVGQTGQITWTGSGQAVDVPAPYVACGIWGALSGDHNIVAMRYVLLRNY